MGIVGGYSLIPRMTRFPVVKGYIYVDTGGNDNASGLLRRVSTTLPRGHEHISLLLPFSTNGVTNRLRGGNIIFSHRCARDNVGVSILTRVSCLSGVGSCVLPRWVVGSC